MKTHTLLSLFAISASLASPLFVAGCAPSSDLGASDDTADEEDSLSATSKTFVTVRRDLRKCMAPLCGGYWVQDVNRAHLNERYVSGLDFTNSGLDEEAINQVSSAGDFEVVLRGKLSAPDPAFNTRTFKIYEVYLGMPSRQPGASDAFYSVTDQGIQCFTAPCNSLSAKRLNHTDKTSFTRTDADLGGNMSAEWLAHEVDEGGAIVSASFVQGATFPGGPETVLDATQVYLRLPVVPPSCPQSKPACSDGETAAYEYTLDRCVVLEGCVEQGACVALAPSCEERYVPVTWPGAPFGCTHYVCEPAWLHPE